jgi:N-acetylglucosamine-6-phosphate deacetylase
VRLGVSGAIVDGNIVPGDVVIDEGRVGAVEVAAPGGRGLAVPGFVDLQVNGFGGVDFLAAEPSEYPIAGKALVRTGVTAYQPTFITSAEETLAGALTRLKSAPAHSVKMLGAHLEGPFISALKPGTHPADLCRDPDFELMKRLLSENHVSYVTMAPELRGALELIQILRSKGIVVSLGHSNATAQEAERAFDSGARTVTHLFNAMRNFSPRDPGIVGAALSRSDVIVQIILDGHHLARQTALFAWRAAAGRLALVTDAVAPGGTHVSGPARIGDIDVEVSNGAVRRPDGTLAGSVLTMIQAVRNLHELGASLEEAVGAATTVPAAVLGREDLGRIQPGSPADITVLDDNLEVVTTLVDGVEQ